MTNDKVLQSANNCENYADAVSAITSHEGVPSQRVCEIDFLKSLFIILMVVFHLTLIGKTYPFAKQVVYMFHMPAFLIISGYFIRPDKKTRQFLRNILWLFVPYAVMETAYTVAAFYLPVTDHINNLTPAIVMHYLFIAPLGPYWYLHTLLLCSVTSFFVLRLDRIDLLSRFLVLATIWWGLSQMGLVSLSNAFYFLAGVVIRQTGVGFLSVFRPSAFAIVPFVIICVYADQLSRGTFSGTAATYLVMCFALFVYQFLQGLRIAKVMLFVGRNTLVILLFSPLFTAASKLMQPLFAFDNTGLLFTFVAVTLTLVGCFSIAWLMDTLHISRFFFGKTRILS